MDDDERDLGTIVGRQVIAVLGVLFVVLAIGWVLERGAEGEPVLNVLIAFGLSAGPGFILIYSWYRLPDTDIDPDYYPVIAAWCLGAVGVAASILILYHVQPADSLRNPHGTILDLSALSSIAGLGVGFHDAQARSRARQLEQRNQELQQMQALLEASNERLEQFAHAVSHDLREPLRTITNYLGLIDLRDPTELDEEEKEFIELAVDGAVRMREMIDGLLEYARVETRSEPFEPVDLNDVLADAQRNLELHISDSGAQLEIEELPRVRGDERQLRQVFQNLLRNAIQYSGDGQPRIHVSAQRADLRWIVSVSDDGIGIEPADQERIFRVFQRLHTHEEHAGTGIGLTLCQRIVEHHGGRIWVESAAGEGSTFSFTLPAVNEGDDD